MVTTNTNTATTSSNNSSSRGNNRGSGNNNGSRGSNSKEYSDYENSTRVAKFIQVCKNLPFVSIMQITAYQCSSSTSSTSAIVDSSNTTSSSGSNMVKTEIIYNSDSTTTTTAQQHSTLPIKPSTTYTIHLNIATPTTTSRNTVTHSNYPHKPKPPAWYLVLGLVHTNNLNITTTTTATATTSKQQQQPLRNIYDNLFQQRACTTLGELLAMKFIGSLPASGGGLSTVSVEFTAPERDDLMEMLTIPTTSSNSTSGSVDNSLQLVVTLMCDSMAGLDYVVAVPVSIL